MVTASRSRKRSSAASSRVNSMPPSKRECGKRSHAGRSRIIPSSICTSRLPTARTTPSIRANKPSRRRPRWRCATAYRSVNRSCSSRSPTSKRSFPTKALPPSSAACPHAGGTSSRSSRPISAASRASSPTRRKPNSRKFVTELRTLAQGLGDLYLAPRTLRSRAAARLCCPCRGRHGLTSAERPRGEHPIGRVMTRDAFRTWAAAQPERWEWVDGYVFPLPQGFAGGTWRHAQIASRVLTILGTGLQPPCRAISSETCCGLRLRRPSAR